jgi:large subunit ribosomal protein L21
MYAILEAGSKQYKVQKGDVIEVEIFGAEPGKTVKLDKVLLYSKGKTSEVGRPYIKGAHVVCDVISDVKADKVITFKYRRRKKSRVKRGHRQQLTRLKVTEIEIGEDK